MVQLLSNIDEMILTGANRSSSRQKRLFQCHFLRHKSHMD